MKKQKKVNTEIIPIPIYELLNERPRCKKCKYRYDCNIESIRSETGAKIYCQMFAKKFYTIEFIIFLVAEVFGIYKIFSLDKELLKLSGFAFAYTIILVICEAFISKMAKIISENKEIKRKNKYEKNIEKIEESNEKIKRMQTGETEEYLEFIKKAKDITCEVTKCYNMFEQMPKENKYNLETSETINKFQNLVSELEKNTIRINPRNYHSNYKLFQTFYGSYIIALIEKMKIYFELYETNKLTISQIEEYNKLLDNFINKVNICNEKIDEVESQKVLEDIKQLNDLISSDNTN